MLMAHSVEGRFPYLDTDVMDFCNGLPSDYKLRGLNEKNILKKAAHGLIPEPIIKRHKQPYRVPEAVSFFVPDTPAYVEELFSEGELQGAGLFDSHAVRGLFTKCAHHIRQTGGKEALSNTDNMAFVGLLSGQLVHHLFIREQEQPVGTDIEFTTHIDRTTVTA